MAIGVAALFATALSLLPGPTSSADEGAEALGPENADLLGLPPEGNEASPKPADEPSDLEIQWDLRAGSVEELAHHSTALVEVEVDAVEPGNPMELNDAGSQVLPTQKARVRVLATLDGSAPDSLELWKIGTNDVYATGDPPYEIGARYVIFIRPKLLPDGSVAGSYIPASPDGRLKVTADGQLQPLIDGPVADQVAAMSPQEIVDAAG